VCKYSGGNCEKCYKNRNKTNSIKAVARRVKSRLKKKMKIFKKAVLNKVRNT